MSVPERPVGAGLASGGLWPAHVPRPTPPTGRVPSGPPGADGVAPAAIQEISPNRWPWVGVEWTIVFVGFLGYILAITTYSWPIGDVSIVIALVGLLAQKEPLRIPGLLKGLGLFLLWGLVGYSATANPVQVYAKLDLLVKVWLIALVASNALRSRAQIRFFVVFWLACFAFFPVRGALFNYYIYGETAFGRAIWKYIFNNPNDLAAYCILQLSMAVGLLSMEGKGPVRWGTIAGLGTLPLLILLTKSRGAFLGFAGFLLLVLAGHRRRGRAIVVTAVLTTLIVAIAPPDVLNRVKAMGNIEGTANVADADPEGSAFQRYEIWKVARLMIKEKPIVGVGLGAYPWQHANYARRPQFDPTARGRRDTHSTYLNLTAESGFVGVTIWLLTYLTAIVHVDRIRRRAKKLLPVTAQSLFAFEAGLFGFFLAAIFGSMAHVSFLMLHMITTWAIAEAAKRELDILERPSGASRSPFGQSMSLQAPAR